MEILGQFVRVEWQEGFSSVGCEKLAGRDEVSAWGTRGQRGERLGWAWHDSRGNPDLPELGSLIQYILMLGCGRLLRFFCLILVVKRTRDYFDLNQFNSIFYHWRFYFLLILDITAYLSSFILAACSLNLVKVLSLKAENMHYLGSKECSLVIYSVVYIQKIPFKVKTAQLMSLSRCVDTGAGRHLGSVRHRADAHCFLWCLRMGLEVDQSRD